MPSQLLPKAVHLLLSLFEVYVHIGLSFFLFPDDFHFNTCLVKCSFFILTTWHAPNILIYTSHNIISVTLVLFIFFFLIVFFFWFCFPCSSNLLVFYKQLNFLLLYLYIGQVLLPYINNRTIHCKYLIFLYIGCFIIHFAWQCLCNNFSTTTIVFEHQFVYLYCISLVFHSLIELKKKKGNKLAIQISFWYGHVCRTNPFIYNPMPSSIFLHSSFDFSLSMLRSINPCYGTGECTPNILTSMTHIEAKIINIPLTRIKLVNLVSYDFVNYMLILMCN